MGGVGFWCSWQGRLWVIGVQIRNQSSESHTMKASVVFSFLFISTYGVLAQGDAKIWTRLPGSSGDDQGYCVAVDNFGNGIVAGATQGSIAGGNAGRYDMFVAKYDSAGTRLWARQRGSDQREFAFGVATDAAGNIYTTGYTGGSFDGNTHSGNNTFFDVFLAKFDASGNWQWTKQFGFSNNDEGRAVTTDRFGNVYITGYVRGALDGLPRPGTADVFIRKYDSNGNKLWSALFGSPDVDESFGIACDADGNVFVTGWCDGSIEGNPYLSNGDNFLVKYDTNGQRLWLKQWGTYNKDTGYSLATDVAGNVYLSGYTTGPLYGPRLGERDIFFAKFDPSGNLIWAKQMGTDGHDQAWGIATDPAGSIYVTGETSGPLDADNYQGDRDIFLTKYDAAGNWQETFQYGNVWNDIARGVAVNTNGDVFIAGWTYTNLDGQSYQGGDGGDPFITKFAFSSNALPCAPKALDATGVTSNSFTASWMIPISATGCRLDVSTNSTFGDYLAGYEDLDVVTGTSLELTGLTPAVTYYYRLRAYNTNGTSENSFTVEAVLAPAAPCTGLLNPDFEGGFSLAGGGSIATAWTEWEADPDVIIGYDETTIVHGGAHSQRISVSGSGATAGGIYQRIPVIANNVSTVSVWIYAGDEQSSCSMGVDAGGGTDASSSKVVWSSTTTNAGWVQKIWTGTPTVNALTVFCKVESADGSARNGYFDDAEPRDPSLPPLPPRLSIQGDGSSLTLTWPECPPALLQQSDTLTASPNWTPTTNEVSFGGGTRSVTLSPTQSASFFRLVLE